MSRPEFWCRFVHRANPKGTQHTPETSPSHSHHQSRAQKETKHIFYIIRPRATSEQHLYERRRILWTGHPLEPLFATHPLPIHPSTHPSHPQHNAFAQRETKDIPYLTRLRTTSEHSLWDRIRPSTKGIFGRLGACNHSTTTTTPPFKNRKRQFERARSILILYQS